MPFSAHEYYAEVSSIAQELLKRELEDGDELYDISHETVGGHQWLIYNRYHFGILKHTSNEDAYFDSFGTLEADSFTDATSKLAFEAFRTDIEQSCEAQRDNAQRTYKLHVYDIEYQDHSGDDLPTEQEFTIIADNEEEALEATIEQLSDEVGRDIVDYRHDTSLTVTFPE